ncbi:hypothetical protein GGE16_005145 [Rhizobium leguminosarum]|uniref:Uncharacterized protein n=1 Tax=Rhizobium leguminosarum TaxID=384 RepID=A0AAE2MPV9_RHILE|nr:hypothetical protein [Rhizobium leguminosarum]MBB4435470.1 hypothetical protein [Rhizobium esperanzae]MBB4300117.1 hypothetical protein [Rhizobium leguminosarum]MBB4311243.1 hypothetical protein [Rhizobium leguminosarum]MBB4532402.1 hypothetical protein [Rhizobium leguminosarum]
MEGFDGRAAADGGERCHVEGASDGGAAASDMALAAPGAALVGDGRDADEGCEFLSSTAPSSGSSAMRTAVPISPMPGAVSSRSRRAAISGSVSMASAMAASTRASWVLRAARVSPIRAATACGACSRRFFLGDCHVDELTAAGDGGSKRYAAVVDMGDLRRPHPRTIG